MRMDMIRVALVGFGGMGQIYAKMIYAGMIPGMVLSGVCCRNAAGQATLKAEFPGVSVYTDTDHMAACAEEFEAVIIVTPHTSHIAIGLQMAKLHKHILMDKPAGIYASEVEKLRDYCQENHLSYAMMFNNRRLPVFRTARQMIQRGDLGNLHRAVWVCNNWYRSPAYHRSAAWRSSWQTECGGMMVNQTPHNLDLWNWLFGMPDKVYADLQFGRYNDFSVDDAADIQFSYENGFHGTFISATGEAPGISRLEIWGSRGCLTIEDNQRLYFDENEVSTEEFGLTNQEKFAAIPHARREISLEPIPNPYQQMLQNFASHLLHGTPLYADGDDGLREVQLANAIYVSGWEEQAVRLPVEESRFTEGLVQRQQQEARH